ncbi:hypothetical protein QZH41_019138, partial [Actinostola sp. cb2023]
VFPELREWCEERHVQLIECDLRWGVPKDTTTEMTIKTCLGEIDRCKEECHGVPFFLNMLGERYGWMPSHSDIPQEIQDQYRWIFPVSITHMEILHAAYRTKNPNAAFFIRDPGFITDIPPAMKPAFVDEFFLNKASLKASRGYTIQSILSTLCITDVCTRSSPTGMLKNKLKERLPNQVFDYACEYDGIDESTGKEKVKLKGLDIFGQNVLCHFKSCIEKTFPASQKELSPEEQELVAHDNFIRSRGSLLLGRKNEMHNIVEYAHYGRLPGQVIAGDGSACPMLLVQGVPGSGKSSLMAYCTLQIKKMDFLLFYHFVGSGPGSTDALKLSNRLYKWLKNIPNTPNPEDEGEKEDAEEIPLHDMQEKMQKVVIEAATVDKTIVIVIDAVNQLSDAERLDHLTWVPIEIPWNVHIILSAVKESRSSKLLLSEEKRLAPLDLFVGELDNSVKREIVNHILGAYNKKLDDQQMSLLIDIEGATNPLWLSLCCEELRVFGVFERVTLHIQSLPSFLEGLLKFILKRLITEDEFNNVEKVLCALYCMSLTETELRYLLKDEDSTEPLPMLKWAVVRRTLKPFLRNTGQQGEEERLDFFHASIVDLVKESLMADATEKKKWHLKIADYFQYICKDARRATEAVAVQLKSAGDKKRLLEFLRSDIRAQKQNPVWKSQYYKFILCGRIIPQIKNFREEVSLCQMCSMQHRGLGQIAGLNKDSCVVCGSFVPTFWREPNHIAMLCQQHKPRHAPGQTMCYICNKPAFFNPQTAYTCMICSAGFQKCVKMVV